MTNDMVKKPSVNEYPWDEKPQPQIVKPLNNPTLFDEPEKPQEVSNDAAGEPVGESPKQAEGEPVGEPKAALPETKKKADPEEIRKYMQDKILGNFTQQELDVLQSTIASGTNKPEFRLFIQTCVNAGLNPFLNHIYPIVYEGKQGRKLTLQISVEGIMSLARKVDGYKGVDVQLVHENDDFRMTRVDGRMTVSQHEIGLPRGQVVGGYAVARREGFEDAIVVMEVDEVKEMKSGRNKDMWNKWFNDMFKKHILKRAAKEQYGIELTEEPISSEPAPPVVTEQGRKIEVEDGKMVSEENVKKELWTAIYAAADNKAMNVDEVQDLIHSKFNKLREDLKPQELAALLKFVEFYKREEDTQDVAEAEFTEVEQHGSTERDETEAEEPKDEYEELFA